MHIICIASCPVGITHTYTTVANLEKAVKVKRHEVKVETQGVQGVENGVAAEDIGRTDGCIIVSDIRIKNSGRSEPVSALTAGVSGTVKGTRTIVGELLEVIS